MAKFDYSTLKSILADELGYNLYSDFGEIADEDKPRREGNKIITPIVGVFRLNATPLTTLRSPYIAVATATMEIASPTDKVDEIKENLVKVMDKLHASTRKIRQGDTSYTVVITFETPLVDNKRRDVGAYGGETVSITQVVTFTVVESGLSSLDVYVLINGLDVPILTFTETRTAASETAPNDHAKGEVMVTQELYGLTLTTPAVENDLGELLGEIVNDGNGNRALAVEVVKGGKSSAYIMTVGTSGTTAQPPSNVGYSLSLAEISPMSAKFPDAWESMSFNKPVVNVTAAGIIDWGDGTVEAVSGFTRHVYTDADAIHTARLFRYGSGRWTPIVDGDILYGARIRPAGGSIVSSSLPSSILEMTTGDTLSIETGRLVMTADGTRYDMDRHLVGEQYLTDEFTSILRGTVSEINTDLLTIDRWSVIEEA